MSNCKTCGKKLLTYPELPHARPGKKRSFCNRTCQYSAPPELTAHWKGDKVGYQGVHGWIRKIAGKPSLCENCGTTTAKKFEWANISSEYKRKRDDWKRLCVSCHQAMDGHRAKQWATIKGLRRE